MLSIRERKLITSSLWEGEGGGQPKDDAFITDDGGGLLPRNVHDNCIS